MSEFDKILFGYEKCTHKVLTKIKLFGHRNANTKELVNYNFKLKNMNEKKIEKVFGKHKLKMTERILVKILNKENDEVIGPYRIDKYTFLTDKIYECVNAYKNAKNYATTRQIVFTFPTEHCFETIQLIRRKNKLNVIVNMRSCNVIDNFAVDMILAYKIGRLFESLCFPTSMKSKKINLYGNFGSLHYFV